jgi:hypothetical protein
MSDAVMRYAGWALFVWVFTKAERPQTSEASSASIGRDGPCSRPTCSGFVS